MKTGIQVSSFRPVLTTEDQVRTAFAKLRAMGCRTVQLQWIDPAVSIDAIAEALEENGIESVSVQDFYQTVLENRDYYYRLNAGTGGRWICVSRIPEGLKSRRGLEDYARELAAMAGELEPMGQRLCFHPVSADFIPIDGIDPVAYLLKVLPDLEICADLYHLNRRGFDVPGWLRRYAGRVCMVHFKEASGDRLVPLGQGDADWSGVMDACRETGVSYAFAEQETWEDDPFRCLGQSLEWLNREMV